MRRTLACLAMVAVGAASSLEGQGVGAEITASGEWDTAMMPQGSAPSTLAGLKQLWVIFGPMDPASGNRLLTSAVADELTSYLQLELRKAGIRLATNPRIVSDSGGYLQVLVAERPRMFGSDWRIRFEILQVAELARDSNQVALLPTWSHDETIEAATADSLRAVIHHSTDVFLSDWLTANGR